MVYRHHLHLSLDLHVVCDVVYHMVLDQYPVGLRLHLLLNLLLNLLHLLVFAHSVIILCFFVAQVSGNFLKIAFFKKGCKIVFLEFLCCKFFFLFILSFFGLLKHYKTRGFSNLGFCCCKRRKKQKKMITGISECGLFWSNNGRFVTHICFFKKCFAETPIFIVFFGCALFGPSCQKREILDTHQKRKNDW